MRLSAKSIVSFANINSYRLGSEWTLRAGDPNTLYFQLVDLDQDGIRYMAIASGEDSPTVTVTFPSIDDDAEVTLSATVLPNDASIWSVNVPADAQINSGSVRFSVTVDGITRKFSVLNLTAVEYPDNDGSC